MSAVRPDSTEAEVADLYHVLLLKDLGCSSNAARICELYLADDLVFKRDFKFINGSLPQALRFVLSHTGMRSGVSERFRAILNIFQNGGEIARELIETRCQRGADIARRMRFSESVAAGIQNLDEHWDGGGKPLGIAGEAIPLQARIALLAQVVDVFRTGAGVDAARREIRSRSGTWFDPSLVAAFEEVARIPAFWSAMEEPGFTQAVLDMEPARSATLVDEDYLDDIAAAFAQVIDSKSPYTSGHSDRVTLFADMIAEQLQFSPEHRRWLKRAALLHDIGKLGVSNTILDKPGKLDEAEWVAMRAHAAHGEAILSRVAAFHPLAAIAGRASRAPRWQGLSEGIGRKRHRARDPHPDGRGRLRRPHGQPPLPPRDAGREGIWHPDGGHRHGVRRALRGGPAGRHGTAPGAGRVGRTIVEAIHALRTE